MANGRKENSQGRHFLDELEDRQDQLWEERVQRDITDIMYLIPGNIKIHKMEELLVEGVMNKIIPHLLLNHNDHEAFIHTRVDDFLSQNIDEILVELEQEKVEISVRQGVVNLYRDILIEKIKNYYKLTRGFIGFLQRKEDLVHKFAPTTPNIDLFITLSEKTIHGLGFSNEEAKRFLVESNIETRYDNMSQKYIVEDIIEELLSPEEILKKYKEKIDEFMVLLGNDLERNMDQEVPISREVVFNQRWKIEFNNLPVYHQQIIMDKIRELTNS